MARGRRAGSRIALVALSALLLFGGTAPAAGHRPGSVDPGFGKDGRVVVSLPGSSSPSWFGPIAPTADGGVLVAYNVSADLEFATTVIERRKADGARDPSFGRGGVVKVRGVVSALAEDASGGVIYVGWDIGRLQPDGAKDKAFDSRAPDLVFTPVKIAFDSSGRILLGGSVATSARYTPHEGQTGIMRLDPDGRGDASFGSGGTVWLGQELLSPSLGGEFGLLPDGTILVLGAAVEHLAADGSALPTPKIAAQDEGSSPSSLVVFSNGSFATAGSPYLKPGCTIVRYLADGTPDPAFAQAGAFLDPGLTNCRITPAPGGGLLVRGLIESNGFDGTPKLQLLTGAGVPVAGFGNGGSVTVPPPAGYEPGGAWNVEGTAFSPDGGLVIAGGGESFYAGSGVATLIGLTAAGRLDSSYGSGGTVFQSASPASWTSPRAVVAMPDGELIVSAMTDAGRASRHPAWMRFGRDGKLIRARSGAAFVSTTRYPLGKLALAGEGEVYGLANHLGSMIVKLKVDGTPVREFGQDGVVHLPHEFRAASFVVDPDGGVTAVGRDRESGRIAAFRLTASGHPDPRFGRKGLALVRARGAAQEAVLLPGGDVLVLASVEGKRFGAVRLGPTGHPRRGFGRDGLLVCRCGGEVPARISAVLHRGHVYVLDHGVTQEGELTALIKLDPGGRLDRSFAGRGWRKVGFAGNSVALFARDDRLLAVGQQGYFTGPSAVRSFRLGGSAVRSYKAGAAVLAGGRRGGARLSAVVQPEGRLVLVGEQRLKKESEGTKLELLGLR